jgi:hypothetical protein
VAPWLTMQWLAMQMHRFPEMTIVTTSGDLQRGHAYLDSCRGQGEVQ